VLHLIKKTTLTDFGGKDYVLYKYLTMMELFCYVYMSFNPGGLRFSLCDYKGAIVMVECETISREDLLEACQNSLICQVVTWQNTYVKVVFRVGTIRLFLVYRVTFWNWCCQALRSPCRMVVEHA
jgi:hypothetical protein